MPEIFLTMPEFIATTKLSRSAAYALVKRERLGVWFGGALRIPESALTQIRQEGGVGTLPRGGQRVAANGDGPA